MATATPLSPAYESLLDYLVEKATPHEILAFVISDEAQTRAVELLERGNLGTLTEEERNELEQMRQADKLVSVLKAKALHALEPS